MLGFPRMGVNRDLKKATEAYWGGKLSQKDLLAEGKRLRQEHWKIQKQSGIDIIPSNDFSFYDQVLDHIQLFGVSKDTECISSQQFYALIDCYRPFLRNIQSISSTPSMNSLPWAGAFKSLRPQRPLLSMYLPWYVKQDIVVANEHVINGHHRKW